MSRGLPSDGAAKGFYGVREIAEAVGITREHAAQLKYQGDLPRPTAVLAMGPLWVAADIEPWIAARRAMYEQAARARDLVGRSSRPGRPPGRLRAAAGASR